VNRHSPKVRKSLLPLALVFVLPGLAGCGDDPNNGDPGSISSPAAEGPLPEDGLARLALLTLWDMPRRTVVDEAPDGDGRYPCGPPWEPDAVTGRAQTGSFHPVGEETPSLQHFVWLLQAGTAGHAMAGLEAYIECLVDAMNGGALDDEDWEFREARLVTPGKPEPLGDDFLLLQVRVQVAAPLEQEAVRLFLDFVAVRHGRGMFVLYAISAGAPFPRDPLSSLTEVALDRLEQTLADGAGSRQGLAGRRDLGEQRGSAGDEATGRPPQPGDGDGDLVRSKMA
jgi:hypothetical protein